jgi:acetyl-CoA carboxylase carboxyl transferase subunit alpha
VKRFQVFSPLKGFNELKDLSTAELIAQRMEKYSKMGEYKE